jgi:cullin-associated NEDD8-dissociated protein 1
VTDYLSKLDTSAGNPNNLVRLLLIIGEIGKLSDLSSVQNILNKIAAFFKNQSDLVRTAASICLGNMSIGNTNFFLGKVF